MWCHALTKWSEEALDAEYGEEGLYGVVSLKQPSCPKLPYTSSVETWINLNLDLFLSDKSLKIS